MKTVIFRATVIALVALANASAFAQVYQWTNLAGMQGGYGNVDGTGRAARFTFPSGVAVDGNGNIYVADTNNSTIRKVTPSGVVTTLAGLAGSSGSSDGSGSAARFNTPYGVAVDSNGNVYVGDSGNSTIRKVTPGGVVTTLAGLPGWPGSSDGTGSAARFAGPRGVAVDGNGNIYVADVYTIRKVTPGGVVTTVAGLAGSSGSSDGSGSAARFNVLVGVALDGNGNVYVGDNGNHTIRKVTPGGVVTTLAGLAGSSGSSDGTGSAARFYEPYGVAADGNGNIYVADQHNSTIRIVTQGGVVTTLAGLAHFSGSSDGTGSAARFYYPQGVAVDGNGNVYVADTKNSAIRKVTSGGVVTTLAGGASGFSSPQGVAVDGNGNVYVADTWNHAIRKVTSGGVVTTLAGTVYSSGSSDGTGSAAQFYFPSGVAVDGNGNVYVADTGNSTIRKVTPGGVVTTLAGLAGSSGSSDGTGSAAQFDQPQGVAVDGNGNVYVADTNNYTIRKVTPAGVVTTIGGTANVLGGGDGTGAAAAFSYPGGVALSNTGAVFVADMFNNRISTGVVVAPPLPVTTAATSITGTGAILNGTMNANGHSTTISFDYGTTVTYGTNLTGTPTPVTGSSATPVSATLAGLTPGTTYHFRVNGTNSGGTSNGTDRTFTTLSNNASLSALTLSTATLSPSFLSSTLNYSASASNGTSLIMVTPTANQPNATIRVNTIAVPSGTSSGNIALNVGSNTITVVVTAQDSITTKTYTVAVTRQSIIETWRQTYFGFPDAGGNRANTADFDGDGKSNLLEFAFGTNPTVSSTGALQYGGTFAAATFGSTGQPIIDFESTPTGINFRAIFIRRVDYVAAGLTYTVQFSANSTPPWLASTAVPTVMASNGTYQIVSVPYPPFLPDGKKARFFMVTVSTP